MQSLALFVWLIGSGILAYTVYVWPRNPNGR